MTSTVRSGWWSLFLAACVAPEPAEVAEVGHADPQNPEVPEDDAPVVAVQRLDGDGPFVAGTTERFGAVLQGVGVPRWSATSGELVADGDEVYWSLPEEAGEHTLTLLVEDHNGVFRHEVRVQTIALAVGAAGVVDGGGDDEAGGPCALVIDASDVPHVVYRNFTHDQLWYARFVAGSWQKELVDGPGFQVGWFVSGQAPSLVVDATGTVHVAFLHTNGNVVYAKRTPAGVWTVEVAAANSDLSYSDTIRLVMDGATPIIFDSIDGDFTANDYARVRASRKGASTWTSTIQGVYTGATMSGDYNVRGAHLTAAGAVRFMYADRGYGRLHTSTWTAAGGFAGSGATVAEYGYSAGSLYHAGRVSMVSGAGYLGAMAGNGLLWSTNGGTSWSNSAYLLEYTNSRALAYDGTQPRLAMVAPGSRIEFARPDSRGYWSYAVAATGVSSSSRIDAALESNGTLHVCFDKDDALWFQ